MAINYNQDNTDEDDDPIEWRRVSKIRRSLQYPKASAPRYSSRPTDLPEVNISKIKKDLEIGHRLNSSSTSIGYIKRNSMERNVSPAAIECYSNGDSGKFFYIEFCESSSI